MKRHYVELWLLLVSAFVFFSVVSAFGAPEIAGYKIKTLGISDIFRIGSSGDTVPVEDLLTEKILAEEIRTEPAVCDSLPKTILFIGDSMLDGLYPRLAAYATANGHTLYAVIWYSSTSATWGGSDKLHHYIDKLKPDYIFICLGANELFVKDIASKRRGFVRRIVSDIGSIPFIWIGPPNWRPDTGINQLIADNVPAGSFFLSKDMTFERAKDGAHPTPASAMQWMDSVVRWMPANAAHPILLDKPDVAKGRAKRVFVHQPNEK